VKGFDREDLMMDGMGMKWWFFILGLWIRKGGAPFAENKQAPSAKSV
jgi:hypothetical protein